jgi:5-methylcytosine-specific restriction endonuclease McrA
MQQRKKRSKIWKLPSHEFAILVSKSNTIGDILKYFGLKNKGGNSNTVKQRIISEGIDMSHIVLGKGSNRGKKFASKKTHEELFCSNSTAQRKDVKYRILKDNLIKYECNECGLIDKWNNKKLVLHLEHINGVSNDHRLENLCFLCPNCHSQTDTYAGKRFKKPSKPKQSQDRSNSKPWLRKVDRPSRENLDKLIEQYPMTTIGKMYGVSDNAVRKWKKYYDKLRD